ncbi:MAG TPA: hypothetical protein VFU76_01015 [Terriglobales bacterium]|nr:hypothetical protein [Terriglobales bacterium]
MRRTILIAGILLLILLFFVPTAMAAERYRLTFPEPVWVGSVLLPAGEYDVRHLGKSARHAMEFIQRETRSPARARARCLGVKLVMAMSHTLVGYSLNDRGERVLRRLSFGGESVEHRFDPGRRP